MDRSQLQLESLKMVKEWCTWLAGLQTGICALLWTPLAKHSLLSISLTKAGFFLNIGWFAFLLALLLTVLLLGRLPRLIEGLEESNKQGKSIFELPLVWKIDLEWMLVAIHFLFFLGLILIGVFVVLKPALTTALSSVFKTLEHMPAAAFVIVK